MLRKSLYFMMMLLIVFASVPYSKAEAATHLGNGLYLKNNVAIEIEGKRVVFSDPILNKGGHLLLPMRDFYEAIGATVTWSKQQQTAGASRNGKTVALTINSKTAKVNGKGVPVSVAPLLYKYRTYVPLRFVSENLDGKVVWNQKEQKVLISMNSSSSGPDADPYILHINNHRIHMTEPVLIKEARTYIPAKYLHEHLENTSGEWLSSREFELQIAGLNFTFTDGSNRVLVNEEEMTIAERPFVQSGEMYVPLHFIVNALGGNLRLLTSKKEIYIYLYHYMFTSEFIEKQHGSTKRPALVPNARLEGERSILVSDNPETLTNAVVPGSAVTLSEQKVQSDEQMNEHRVFGWHFNRLGKMVRIGITIENHADSLPLTVESSKGYGKISGNSWINYDIGLPIADALLNQQLKASSSEGITVEPGETKVIEEYVLHPNYILGFLQDIDLKVDSSKDSQYTIRTVLAKNGEELTDIHSAPVSVNRSAAHPRGVWPSSVIAADFPTYTIGSPEVGYNLSNGKTDHLLTGENSLSQINGSIGNPGHFGLVYQVNIPIINPTGEKKAVKLKLAGRGGLYSGAIKVNGEVHLIPTLKVGTEYVQFPDYWIEETSEIITIELMHAGGASLPAAIYVDSN